MITRPDGKQNVVAQWKLKETHNARTRLIWTNSLNQLKKHTFTTHFDQKARNKEKTQEKLLEP